MAKQDPFLLKDLFDRKSVGEIADAVEAALPTLDRSAFMDRVFDDGWSGRELKQRMRHITSALRAAIPGGYREQLQVLLVAADHAVEGFAAVVYPDFVQAYGTEDWEASVPALARFTRLASAEFAVRPFIAADPRRTLAEMYKWAGDAHQAVRRLATEGCRPRLPWGMRLHALVADPEPILPILERLYGDPDESVRRSVANNLNDISRDHPGLVVTVLKSWRPEPGTDTYRLARHALRTLLKRGHPGALSVLGFKAGLSVELKQLSLDPPAPRIDGAARLSFSLTSTLGETQPVMVDYAVHYVKAGGGTAPKVFRLGSVTMEPGQTVDYSRKISFRQMTTRTHRAGTHRIDILANGAVAGSMGFELATPE